MKKKSGKTESTGDVKKDDEEQSQRFIEKAKELGVDISGKQFKKVVTKIKDK